MSNYPCIVECYRLVPHDKEPASPESAPVERIEVNNAEEEEMAIVDLSTKYPGGWIIVVPG